MASFGVAAREEGGGGGAIFAAREKTSPSPTRTTGWRCRRRPSSLRRLFNVLSVQEVP